MYGIYIWEHNVDTILSRMETENYQLNPSIPVTKDVVVFSHNEKQKLSRTQKTRK